jgi:hypothetical protein
METLLAPRAASGERRPPADCGSDGPSPRPRRMVAGLALLVALTAGAAVAYFLSTEHYRQSVVSEPLEIVAPGLEDVFGDPRVQPWNLPEGQEDRVTVVTGSFEVHNTNEMDVTYELASVFLREVAMIRDASGEREGAEQGRQQFDQLEVRHCDLGATDGELSLLAPLTGAEADRGTCGAWIGLAEIEDGAGSPLALGTLPPGETRRHRLDLRLRDTRSLQRDDLRTSYDLVIHATAR